MQWVNNGVRRGLVVADFRNHQQIFIPRRAKPRMGSTVRTEQVCESWERREVYEVPGGRGWGCLEMLSESKLGDPLER